MLQVGSKAPDFTLYNSDKQEVNLSSFKGKSNVVLLFYPAAFTSVCTKELCETRDNIAYYNNVDAKVFGISVDMLFTLAKFKEDQKLNFDLLSDWNKTVSADYDSLLEDFAFGIKGVSKRSSFVIDKQGIVQHIEICPTPGDYPDFAAIQATLNQLN